MKSPFISRVNILNFRNFKNIDVNLNHKQVIIGENNVGKTNFLRAIQIILDRNYSDIDRELSESDFNDEIDSPFLNGEEIKIVIEIRNYEHNRQLVAQFEDAVVLVDPPTLRFTYKYFPLKDETGAIVRYQHHIYKGATEEKFFKSEDRNFLNIQVIGALRDVEKELSANKRSPLFKLIKQYEISEDELVDISNAMQDAAEEILNLDEIKDIKNIIENKFKTLAGLQQDNMINIRPYDIDSERLLYAMQVYMGLSERPVSELSLGLSNILYVTMMMLLIRDRTIPRILKKERYDELILKSDGSLISDNYTISESQKNYLLNDNINSEISRKLYQFFDQNNYQTHTTTILALEEPEAHLHPVLQRLIYREVLQKSETSVIFTTHSPYITAITPINSIVHMRYNTENTEVHSTANLHIDPKERVDIERYLDAKRGEIYFGKGVILVEGITEEYIVPKTAEMMGTPLDDFGIVICNVHSTNFKPYLQILQALGIPWCLITDGDYYETEKKTENGKEKIVKHYHRTWKEGDELNLRGLEIISNVMIELGFFTDAEVPVDYVDKYKLLEKYCCHIGFYTFEIDLMKHGGESCKAVLKTVYAETISGGEQQQENFNNELDSNEYWQALGKIESNVGKGRFAQRVVQHLRLDFVPNYIKNAITAIVEKVQASHE